MPHLTTALFIFIFLLIQSTKALNNNKTNPIPEFPKYNASYNLSSNLIKNGVEHNNSRNTPQAKVYEDTPEKKVFLQAYSNEADIPESLKMGFYFIGLVITGILFILLKIHRMRLSRAERKYGVHGDRSTQELTPLPMAIEDDSDNEDHTVFDINRQIRVS